MFNGQFMSLATMQNYTYLPAFEKKKYIPTNFQSFYTLHTNDALKQRMFVRASSSLEVQFV